MQKLQICWCRTFWNFYNVRRKWSGILIKLHVKPMFEDKRCVFFFSFYFILFIKSHIFLHAKPMFEDKMCMFYFLKFFLISFIKSHIFLHLKPMFQNKRRTCMCFFYFLFFFNFIYQSHIFLHVKPMFEDKRCMYMFIFTCTSFHRSHPIDQCWCSKSLHKNYIYFSLI